MDLITPDAQITPDIMPDVDTTQMAFAPLPKNRVSTFTPPTPKGPTLEEGEGPLRGITDVVSNAAQYAPVGEGTKIATTALANAAETGTSPETLKWIAPVAAAGPLAPLVSAGFAGTMGKGFVEQNIPEIAEAYVNRDRDPEALNKALAKGATTLGFAGMAGAHAVGGGVDAIGRLAKEHDIAATPDEIQAAADALRDEATVRPTEPAGAPPEAAAAGQGGNAPGEAGSGSEAGPVGEGEGIGRIVPDETPVAGGEAPVNAAEAEGYPRNAGGPGEEPPGPAVLQERNAPEALPLRGVAGPRMEPGRGEDLAAAAPEPVPGAVRPEEVLGATRDEVPDATPAEIEEAAKSLGAAAGGDLDRAQQLSRFIPEKPSTLSEIKREIGEQLSPVQVDEASRIFGGHLKEQNAIQALEFQRFSKAAKEGMIALDRLSPEEQNDFFDRSEKGEPQATPELQGISDTLRKYQDTQAQQLIEGGHLNDVIENYMPHQYENEALGLKLFNQRQSSIPNWQKERTYPLRSEAAATGLTPKYPNPVEDVLTSYGRKGDYLATANAIKGGIADGVIQVWDRNTAPTPGADLVELDPKFVKMAGDAVEEGQTLAAPRSVATLLKRNTDVGLGKYAWYRGARAVAGGINTAQLLGPFHAATTILGDFNSRLGQGIMEAVRSAVEPNMAGSRGAEAAAGAADIATSPIAAILDGINGYKARMEALDHSGLSDTDKMLVAGGHRIDMAEDYTMGATMAFRRALAQDKNFKAAGLLPGAILEKVMSPIMQVLVPSVKTGAYLEAAAAELRRLGPDASDAQKRQALGRISDAVDDRFGQLNYDNAFWNKTARNTMQLLMRSAGWVTGSLRAGLGGLKDIATAPSRFKAQRANPEAVMDPVITTRMGYLAGQAIGPMLTGTVYAYIKGVKQPDNKKYLDYVAPLSGGTNKAGTPERYVPAGYTKETYAWGNDPFATAMSKRNPMISLAQDLSAGKDFRGTPFVDPTAPFLKRQAQRGLYAAQQFAPIFSRGTLLPDPNINPRSNIGLAERMVGAPAPAYMASQEKMDKAARSRFLKTYGKGGQ